MLRAAIFLAALIGLTLALQPGALVALVSGPRMSRNVQAFGELIGQLESNGQYNVIAGGDHFTDYAEHPFVLDPSRVKTLGTTAAGKYQMVRKTWSFARDALGLPDFSPESQDAAFAWLLEFKEPGQDVIVPGGTGNLQLVESGDLEGAIAAYRLEWEALDKVLKGKYGVTLAQAQEIFLNAGGASA